MVPVRKPGRPLSACPHPRDRSCNCGSVTAAIPKRQACHCGGNPSNTAPEDAVPQDSDPLPAEPISPARTAFKVQKPSARSHSSRKQSFDIANFDRMDMNNVNVVSFEPRPTNALPIMYPNGYAISDNPQEYGFVPQYADFQTQDYKLHMQLPLHITSEVSTRMNSLDGGIDQAQGDHSFDMTIHLTNGEANEAIGTATSSAAPGPTKATNGETKRPTNGNSCCATKPPVHSHSSSTASSISEPQEPRVPSCCSSKPPPLEVKDEPTSNDGPVMNLAPQADHQVLLNNGTPLIPIFYPQYISQDGVFTYPPTYGSFNNPLEPASWRQSVRMNGHIPLGAQNPMTSGVAASPPVPAQASKDTVHTCRCGDGCQCVGCAAHPYNDATQNYVRSAYTSMFEDAPSREPFANGALSNEVGGIKVNGTRGADTATSPTANTPSSATSTNADEQNLSAADFFFVNYSFPECGGDTESCPCGDDCQCIGCTIHNLPA